VFEHCKTSKSKLMKVDCGTSSNQVETEKVKCAWEPPVLIVLDLESTADGPMPFTFEEGIYGPS